MYDLLLVLAAFCCAAWAFYELHEDWEEKQ